MLCNKFGWIWPRSSGETGYICRWKWENFLSKTILLVTDNEKIWSDEFKRGMTEEKNDRRKETWISCGVITDITVVDVHVLKFVQADLFTL